MRGAHAANVLITGLFLYKFKRRAFLSMTKQKSNFGMTDIMILSVTVSI